jgi:dihydrofolate reductase
MRFRPGLEYVASTLREPQWANTTVLSRDIAAAVNELRAEPAGELQMWGSGILIRWLIERRLIYQIVLLTYPESIGQGRAIVPCHRSEARARAPRLAVHANRADDPLGLFSGGRR